MILKCKKCDTSFQFKNKSSNKKKLKVRCSICKSIYVLALNKIATNVTSKQTQQKSPTVENNSKENYEYYIKAEDEIVKKRKYFKFHDDSMFKRLAQQKRDSFKENRQSRPAQYIDEIESDVIESPDLLKKAEQDFKERLAIFGEDDEDSILSEELSDEELLDEEKIISENYLEHELGVESVYIEENKHTNEIKDDHSLSTDWLIDDIDEFDENLPGFDFYDVETDSRLTDEERAHQMAQITCEMIGWTKKHEVALLAQIFTDNGWSLTRNRLMKEIRAGMTFEMVELAVKIRKLWNTYDEFTIGYYKGWVAGMHINVTWSFCYDLMKRYGSLPDVDEIEFYLLEMFDSWYHTDAIKNHFLTFYNYIQFRTRNNSIPFEMAPIIPYQEINRKEFDQYNHMDGFDNFMGF